MKMLLVAIAMIGAAYGQSAIVGQVHKTVTTAGTPLQVSSTDLYVRQACFQCSSANTGTTCFMGTSAAKAVAAQGITMAKPTATAVANPYCVGEVADRGAKLNLKDIWVDVASNADEVNVFFVE